MNNLMDLLQSQLGENAIQMMASQFGNQEREKTQAATSGILSMLTAALAKNTSSEEGARALDSALERDHDGSILEDLESLIQGEAQPSNAKAVDGEGILKHLLGDGKKKENAIQMISRMSGLEKQNISGMMATLAPMVLGALGKQKREQGLGASDIAGLLNTSVQERAATDDQMGMIGKFIDKDGDGSILDDIADMGLKALFRRR